MLTIENLREFEQNSKNDENGMENFLAKDESKQEEYQKNKELVLNDKKDDDKVELVLDQESNDDEDDNHLY